MKLRETSAGIATSADAERAHITAMLRETNWVAGGPHGAATRLGLARPTLIAKVQRLGISHKALTPPTRQSNRPFVGVRVTPSDLAHYVPKETRTIV